MLWVEKRDLQKFCAVLREILPKNISDSLCAKGSRLAHLYGLPKTHKANLSMRPILSATGTYNYNLAKWLEEKLKPLSVNEYTITDAISFSEEIRNVPINEDSILVSYDVTAGADPGEVKWVNFLTPLLSFSFFFLIPQILK